MSRLPDSKRNALIADFQEGIINEDYEVIPSKTTKGRYTVRRRNKTDSFNQLITPPIEDPNNTDLNQGPQSPSNNDDVSKSYDLPKKSPKSLSMDPSFIQNNYLQEYQMQINRMLIEQVKALRQNNKYLLSKQKKYKTRQQKITSIFQDIANNDEDTQENEEESQEQEQSPEESQPKPIEDYFTSEYQTSEAIKPVQLENPIPQPETPQYLQSYESQLDQMAGNHLFRSRRDKLKAFI